MEKRALTNDEVKRLYNRRSLEDLKAWFADQRLHAIPGDAIETPEEWAQMTTFDSNAEVMGGYQEAPDETPYIFGGKEYTAVYADPFCCYVAELTISGEATGHYAIISGTEIIYG